MQLMSQHQNAFMDIMTTLCSTVAGLEEKVYHHHADMTVRVDDLERNLKNLAFNIQGFAPSKQEEEDMEADRQYRISKKKNMLKTGSQMGMSLEGSFDSNDEQVEKVVVEKKAPPKPTTKKVVPVPEPEPVFEPEPEPVVEPEKVVEPGKEPEPIATLEEEKKEDTPSEEPTVSRKMSTEMHGSFEELPYKSTPESKARATKRWKWALRQLKARFIAKTISMTNARVNPKQSIGNRMTQVEQLISHLQFEVTTLKLEVDQKQHGMMEGLKFQLSALKESMAAMEEANQANDKKVKNTLGDLKSLREDFSSSTREIGDLKNEVEEKVQKALTAGSTKAAKKAKKDKQEGLIKIMMDDLEGLQDDVKATMESGASAADPALLEQLLEDIEKALLQVKQDPQSDATLMQISLLQTDLQTVLGQDAIVADKVEEGEDEVVLEKGLSGHAAGRRKSLALFKTRSHRASIEELGVTTLDGIDEDEVQNSEENLRDRMKGTGQRLNDLMAAFSNVGKLELAVRQLQGQMEKNTTLQKQISTDTAMVKEKVETRADKVETDSSLAQKADLNMVQGLLADLQLKQDELYHRTQPEEMAKQLNKVGGIGNNAIDELSASLAKTVDNFGQMKKDLSSKAAVNDVTAAINGIQNSVRSFVGETFSRDELSSVLSNKVDKRELKKLATALAGIDGPANLTAGVVKCLVCERPGYVQQQEQLATQMGSNHFDPLDGRSKTPGSSGNYDLPAVQARGRSAGGPESDDINRYKEEELMGGVQVNKHPRIMPPANRMRVSAGGGMRVSGGRSGGR
ncbi:hypothetical protein TrLO_g6597 [Triparma laevis f. longispina]|uniref:Uncharacterized protein n=1 Tax=Triparma laevis f. longispina TaxID=1714387 RepID=A0A9W7FNU0_9STRA|nr:hypothetical protein TrLO_g6597 [Triparma laevis f. longispina]